MSSTQENIEQPSEPTETTTPEPRVKIEERRLTLNDFTKTAVKLNASDVHLQAGSVPMIRVDGRARFLDCPASSDTQMAEYLDIMLKDDQQRRTLKEKGSVDLAYPMPDGTARFRVSIFHSRGKYAIVMRRIVTKIPNFDEINLPKQVEEFTNFNRGIVLVSGTTGS